MSKIALATAIVALAAASPLAIDRAAAQPPAPYLAPGAAPPWADATTTATATTTETPPAPSPGATPAAVPAAQPAQTAEPGETTPIPVDATPMQGMTTPIQAVSLRSGPSTASPVIGTLHPGMALRVLASANYGWIQVETPTGSGWAYGSYLAPAGNTAVVEPEAPPQEIIAW
jgi:SH3 domain-containing protein